MTDIKSYQPYTYNQLVLLAATQLFTKARNDKNAGAKIAMLMWFERNKLDQPNDSSYGFYRTTDEQMAAVGERVLTPLPDLYTNEPAKRLLSTIVYTKTDPSQIKLSETLRETAWALHSQRGMREFHAVDIVDALYPQGVEVSEQQVRNRLSYSGASYKGKPCKRHYWELEKLPEGMYRWRHFSYDPSLPAEQWIQEID